MYSLGQMEERVPRRLGQMGPPQPPVEAGTRARGRLTRRVRLPRAWGTGEDTHLRTAGMRGLGQWDDWTEDVPGLDLTLEFDDAGNNHIPEADSAAANGDEGVVTPPDEAPPAAPPPVEKAGIPMPLLIGGALALFLLMRK